MNNWKAWLELIRTAILKGVIKHYVDDLVEHDRANLSSLPEGIPFLWIMRGCGTDMVPAPTHDLADRVAWHKGRGAVLQHNIDNQLGRQFYLYSEGSLVQVTPYEAKDKLFRAARKWWESPEYKPRLPTANEISIEMFGTTEQVTHNTSTT